jgi:hypothetical protein
MLIVSKLASLNLQARKFLAAGCGDARNIKNDKIPIRGRFSGACSGESSNEKPWSRLRAGPQTVFISTRSDVNKRQQHPVKASLDFLIFGFNLNVSPATAINPLEFLRTS